MDTILAYGGRICYLSDEVYELTEMICDRYLAGLRVRLISGIDGSNVPGYHFYKGYCTVHLVNNPHATFVGVKQSQLRLVEGGGLDQ